MSDKGRENWVGRVVEFLRYGLDAIDGFAGKRRMVFEGHRDGGDAELSPLGDVLLGGSLALQIHFRGSSFGLGDSMSEDKRGKEESHGRNENEQRDEKSAILALFIVSHREFVFVAIYDAGPCLVFLSSPPVIAH